MKALCTALIMMSMLLSWHQSSAQLNADERAMIAQIDFTDHQFDPRKPTFLKVGSNAFTRYNPISLAFGSMLFVYQKAISPQLQSKCPYEISCSAFSKACIQHFGLIKGIALTADRLTRCTQFSVIDILPSQIDEKRGFIRDDLSKYEGKNHHH